MEEVVNKGKEFLVWSHSKDNCMSHNFTYKGVPVIQMPQDLMMIGEIIYKTQPEQIVECGIAHGGSLLFYSDIIVGRWAHIYGYDVNIKPARKHIVESHPYIRLYENSSTAYEPPYRDAVVILDSNHTKAHVAEELRLYSPCVSKGFYLIVMDTCIADFPKGHWKNRPWDKDNSPRQAVDEFLKTKEGKRFRIDKEIDKRLMGLSAAPGGYLKCVK